MSTDNVQKFTLTVATDPELRAKVRSLLEENSPASTEAILALAAENGTPFTPEEFFDAGVADGAELSDEQLARVSGGNKEENFAASVMTAVAVNECKPPPPPPSDNPYANYKPLRWK